MLISQDILNLNKFALQNYLNNMGLLLEIAGYTLPVLVVMTGIYFFLRLFFNREDLKRKAEQKDLLKKETLMLRLQAYERLILLLERMTPSNLIMRLNKSDISAREFHLQLLANIRAEFDHNLAQQLYISNKAWQNIIQAKEEIIKLINFSKENTSDTDSAIKLSKTILSVADQGNIVILNAVNFLKEEAKQLF